MAVGTLTKIGGNLENPRDSKPSDYPAVGPSGAAGEASGAGKLVTQTEAQEGPRHTEDGGENTPAVWGKAEGFTVAKNKGEGSGGSAVKCDWSVDLSTGQVAPPVTTNPY